MKIILPLMLLVSGLSFAQDFSPLLDENKFTVCAITINSDTEKKIFEKQIAKEPKKFNPIVELTNFGDDQNWFEKACSSGVRCDQLVISGHFAGEFFGKDSEKTLGLHEIEKAGCAKSCDGILNKPYEVFLFGCNTLAEKDEDSRTPAEYLQVLLQDGFSQQQAEMVVQSRYGSIGDSNRASMQRAFAGDQKKLYGFTSSGPSGQTVKKFLDNHFKKTKLSNNLEKMQASRMLNQVTEANKILANSLKSTTFTQCDSVGELKDEKSKNICALKDPKTSLESKLALTLELLQKDDALLYLPTINQFLMEYPSDNFTSEQMEQFKLISNNKVIKEQFIGLIEKTDGLGLKETWVDMSFNFGFIDKDQAKDYLLPEYEKLFSKPLKDTDLNIVCTDEHEADRYFKMDDDNLKNKKIGKAEIFAYSCLGIEDEKTIKRVMAFDPKGDKNLIIAMAYLAEYLPEDEPLPAPIIKYLKAEMYGDEDPGFALNLLYKHYPKDKDLLKRVQDIVKNGKEDEYLISIAKTILEKIDAETKGL